MLYLNIQQFSQSNKSELFRRTKPVIIILYPECVDKFYGIGLVIKVLLRYLKSLNYFKKLFLKLDLLNTLT